MIISRVSRSSHSSQKDSMANMSKIKYQKELLCRRKREGERERERRKEKKAGDSSRKSRGTAAADLCGDENPGKVTKQAFYLFLHL